MTTRNLGCPEEHQDALDRAERRHGPAMNYIASPPGLGCPAGCGYGPTTVHLTVLVWLLCGHVKPLPRLHIDMTRPHGKAYRRPAPAASILDRNPGGSAVVRVVPAGARP